MSTILGSIVNIIGGLHGYFMALTLFDFKKIIATTREILRLLLILILHGYKKNILTLKFKLRIMKNTKNQPCKTRLPLRVRLLFKLPQKPGCMFITPTTREDKSANFYIDLGDYFFKTI